ncbi:S-DNA-T family DNA segregation ATPase FtsK/SpoIIIE [Actinoalloteichus hoggarensis]|uniref:DNA translocase SpoIIIE n=1 Tax=Actinoalloteichus hoggarensis TaxID=1470176 RepID=A0A221W715_9PSEU|nr:cell division protein FtsK [Actinoalloteichus hoggarensis]ASO21544.1 DNA translocase SpoIIIE [Actinoalloteichus hoggarensis]MBB5922135.1 S-DNA-T family DNA segregation ATPase FtsK/SpoIIIE [Actinoalloteichus hoggarensis]
MGKSKAEVAKRVIGAEFRAALWAVRHPGMVAVPSSLAASAWQFGPTVTGIGVGAVVAGTVGWYRAHPDTFDTVAAPWLRSWRRRWASAYSGHLWRHLMADCGLTREHRKTKHLLYPRVVRVRSWSPSVDTVTVALVPGQSTRKFIEAAESLAESLRAERVAVERHRPGQVVLVVQRDEPFTEIIPAPVMPLDVEDVDLSSVYVGETEYGHDWREPMLGAHFLNAGATGAGKNSIGLAKARSVAPLIRDGLVKLWVCDPKLFEFSMLEPILEGRYANSPDDCLDLVEQFANGMEATQRRMKRAGVRSVPVSREYPLHWLLIDEIGSLLAYRPEVAHEMIGQLSMVASMGRATHHSLDVYIQEPSKDVIPIRDLLPNRVCLRVNSASHPDMVLGDGARERGAIADQLPAEESAAGIGFRRDQRSRVPRRVRAAYTSDDDIKELVDFVKSSESDSPNLRAVA